MANLDVEVAGDKGAMLPFVVIDGAVVPLVADKGQVSVTGSSGDGLTHMLMASFEGPAGATLAVAVSCAGATVCEIKAITVQPANEPHAGSRKHFKM